MIMRISQLLIPLAAALMVSSCGTTYSPVVPAERQSCLWSDCLQDTLPGVVTAINPGFDAEEFRITTEKGTVRIEGGSRIGVLYGTYEYQRQLAAGTISKKAEIRQKPAYKYRILHHWDNIVMGGASRGSGRSLWYPSRRPFDPEKVREYARACASVIPTMEISGSQYTQEGIRFISTCFTGRPAI